MKSAGRRLDERWDVKMAYDTRKWRIICLITCIIVLGLSQGLTCFSSSAYVLQTCMGLEIVYASELAAQCTTAVNRFAVACAVRGHP